MSWSEERIEELTRLWQAGHSASDIGKRLGISKNAVVGKAHRLKLPSRPSPIKHNSNGSKSQATCRPAKTQPTAQPAQAHKASARRSNVRAVTSGGVRSAPPTQVKSTGGGSGCLWPIGDPGDPDFHFCGADALPGKPYCSEHAARAYITRSRERDEEAA